MVDLFDQHGHNSSMRFLPFTLIFLVFFTSCALLKSTEPVRSTPPGSRPPLKIPAPKVEKVASGTTAYWELLSNKKLSLQFKSLDDGSNLTVIIEKGISDREVSPGHWELTGFEVKGKSYLSMNTSKKFVFRMSEKNSVYAGSIVIGCPKISSSENKHLMKMKFFNRYPFSSSSGLCELVVGNDFNGVREKVKKSRKSKKLNLILGF